MSDIPVPVWDQCLPERLSAGALETLLRRFPPARRYWIAYSGGLDSQVLLHLAAALRDLTGDFSFAALHVNHGLQPQAEQWVEHCRRGCQALSLPLRVVRVDAAARPGESPEEAARNARAAGFREVLESGEMLLTAQHADDQLETVLLQLFRGAGPAGLAGMAALSRFGKGWLGRPLLAISRSAIMAYGREHDLAWEEDPSNRDPAYARNYLRHKVLPLLRQRWPGIGRAVARSARHCAEADALIGEQAGALLQPLLEPRCQTLSIAGLQQHKPALQRQVLRAWIRRRGWRCPSAQILDQVRGQVIAAGPDRLPRVAWSEGEIRRYRDALFLLPRLGTVAGSLSWDGREPLFLAPEQGFLQAFPGSPDSPGIARRHWVKAAITVRFRRGGERCRIAGRGGHHSLKHLFQEAAVPPWVRERIPLLYLDGKLAAVAGLWVCEPFLGAVGEETVVIRWQDHDLGWKVSDSAVQVD